MTRKTAAARRESRTVPLRKNAEGRARKCGATPGKRAATLLSTLAPSPDSLSSTFMPSWLCPWKRTDCLASQATAAPSAVAAGARRRCGRAAHGGDRRVRDHGRSAHRPRRFQLAERRSAPRRPQGPGGEPQRSGGHGRPAAGGGAGRGLAAARRPRVGRANCTRACCRWPRRYDVAIAGGDTNSWDGPLAMSGHALGPGHRPRAALPRRRAARRPDRRHRSVWRQHPRAGTSTSSPASSRPCCSTTATSCTPASTSATGWRSTCRTWPRESGCGAVVRDRRRADQRRCPAAGCRSGRRRPHAAGARPGRRRGFRVDAGRAARRGPAHARRAAAGGAARARYRGIHRRAGTLAALRPGRADPAGKCAAGSTASIDAARGTLHLSGRRRSRHRRAGPPWPMPCPPATTVALCGTLGAGKTRLVQAIADGRRRRSPQRGQPHVRAHPGVCGPACPIYHIDAYRLRDDDEFQQLGPDEYFESRRPGADRMGRSRAGRAAGRAHGDRHHGDRRGNRGGLPSRPSAAAMPRCSTRWRPGSVETGSALSSQERASQRRRSAGFRRRRRAQRYDEYPRRCLQAVADGHLHLKRAPRAGRGRT